MSKPKRGVFMKKARKISCLLAIIMSVMIASCSNASGGSSTPPSVPNTPQQDQLQDQPQVKFTKLSIPKASVAYAGQALTATLVGLNFPYKIYEYLNEIDPTTGMYKQKLTEKSYKEITHFFSNIRITCESNPSIVTQPSPAYCDCGYRQSVFITISLNIPNNIGEYDITVSYGDESITSTLSVKDYSAYHAGDVLLNDGSTIPYDANSYSVKYENDSNGYTIREYTRYKAFSSDEKANAVGVLCGFNEYGAPIGWLGVYNSGYTDYQWRANEFNMLKHYDSGYEIILCEPDKWDFNGLNNYMSKFLGDTDGSDNWNYICSIDPMGTADTETNYPAFNFVNNYATTYGLSGEYAVGWYMPSIAELCYMYKNKDALDAVLFALGGNAFTPKDSYENMFGKTYFSSSICHNQRDLQVLDSSSGALYMHYGFTSSNRVCCMLPFERTNQSGTEIVNDGSVSQVTLNKTQLTLTVGDTETLTATVLPSNAIDKTVTWESSAPNVATVSNGVVTAVSKGNAVITAKAETKSTKCTVTVNPVTYQISVTNGTATPLLAEEGATVTIKANNPPSGKSFDKWTTTTEGITFANATAATTTFKMPAKAVSVTANYCEYYTVTYVDNNNITVPSDNKKYKAGETVTVLFSGIGYRKGFTFSGWCDNKGNSYTSAGTKTFAMPASNVTLTAEWNRIKASGKIGMYETPCDVGDVVFKDGSATPYQSVTESQKESAIAVIFYVGTANNLLGKKTLGVGIYNTRDEVDEYYSMPKSTLQWAAYNSDALFKYISGIICEPSHTGKGAAAIATFTGDLDGSDNWNQLRKEVTDTNIYSSDGTPINTYPAWKWVNDYANNSASHVSGSNYKTGWYMPSIAELCMLWQNRRVVNNAISSVGGSTLREGGYWSSSQHASHADGKGRAYGVDFYSAGDDFDGYISVMNKDEKSTEAVCAIHAF